jgi:hypothetical protein
MPPPARLCQAIRDRHGNTVTITHASGQAVITTLIMNNAEDGSRLS